MLETSGGDITLVQARALVNAAGPWAGEFLRDARARSRTRKGLRLVKGSHIVVRKHVRPPMAYIFQNPDKRIIFAIPYESDYTLIGTTDVEHKGPVGSARIDDERDRLPVRAGQPLLRAAGRLASDVVWTYAGVRPLLDDDAGDPAAVTRDYLLELDTRPARRLLSVWGGKITTFRKLAEEAADLLVPAARPRRRRTGRKASSCPAATLEPCIGTATRPDADFERFEQAPAASAIPGCPRPCCIGWRGPTVRASSWCWATRRQLADLGEEVAPGLHEAELDYLRQHEWAASADDVLWRRSKLGLHCTRPSGRRWRTGSSGSTPTPRRPRSSPRIRRSTERTREADGDTMQLMLERIEKQVGPQTHLYPTDLALQSRAVTVLLGATQAGKTSLMRLMAGLDAPSKGRVTVDGADVTGVPVRERNVAMVYQQFINYPSMKVADNIASPLKLRGEKNIDARVRELAARLHIEPFLDRLPAELSGGQQQRVALARALAKKAPLMLLDEPLVNLDYKLREELREELSQLFATGDSTVVYATTEPAEALLLGGYTAVLDAGELLQYGPTAEVFHRPQSMRVARAFSDPPMNLIAGEAASLGVQLAQGVQVSVPLPAAGTRAVTLGVRASALRVRARAAATCRCRAWWSWRRSRARTPSCTSTRRWANWWRSSPACTTSSSARSITLYLHPSQAYVFDEAGALLVAPERASGRPRGLRPKRRARRAAERLV